MKHPGTPILWNPSMPVAEGGLPFRARYGVERNGENLLAEGSYPPGSEIEDGYPEFTMEMLQKLGWDKDLTDDERKALDGVGGAKASCQTAPTGRLHGDALKQRSATP